VLHPGELKTGERARVPRSSYDRPVRWVQKISESGDLARYTSFLVRDKENGPVSRVARASTVSPAEAERLVASGEWRYVETRATD
jgi:hypothetical protein